MTSLSTLLKSIALPLLVTAVACGESATEVADAARQRAAYANAQEDDPNALMDPPVWSLQLKRGTSTQLIEHMPPGFAPPPGQFYGFDLRAIGFPAGKRFDFQLLGVLINDRTVLLLGAGSGGAVPADGSFRTGGSMSCPVQYSDMWVIVNAAGRKWESPHWVPQC